MDHVLNWVWQGSVLAIGAAAVLKWLDGSRAQVRYLVCWLALLAVLALPLLSRLPPSPMVPGGTAIAPDGVLMLPGAWWTSSALAASLWIAWFSFHAARFAAAARAVRRARRETSAFPVSLELRLRFWRTVSGLGRRTGLGLSEGVRSAGLLGGGRPVIAVAPVLLERLDMDELDRVIVHEWAHAQRFDDLTHAIQLLVRAVAGWHPAVWWLDRQLRLEREIACDEAAVAVTGCSKSYAACLTTLATAAAGRRQVLPALDGLGTTALSTRITRLLSKRPIMPAVRSKRVAAAGVVCLSALALALADIRLAHRAPAWALRAMPERLIRLGQDRTLPATPPATVRAVRDAGPTGSAPLPGATGGTTTAEPPAPAHLAAAPRSLALIAEAPILMSSQPTISPAAGTTPDPAPPDDTSVLVPAAALDPAAAASHPMEDEDAARATPATERSRGTPSTPWAAAADAGAAIGERSQEAGAATGAFFGRLGRRIARSF